MVLPFLSCSPPLTFRSNNTIIQSNTTCQTALKVRFDGYPLTIRQYDYSFTNKANILESSGSQTILWLSKLSQIDT